MSDLPTLGRLDRVDLRTVWTRESDHFTPWLAAEFNLALLGEAIGIELEFEAREKDVGPFRADILCKNAADGSWVLIENQLEATDHRHLGQVLTYAAGLDAVTVIWIASKFTEEHRATVDWLNQITADKFRFFGLEVELWRIGESPPAPKFNIVAKPNDWTSSVASAARTIADGSMTEIQDCQLQFWTAFNQFLEDGKYALARRKPAPQHWLSYSVGRSDFGMNAYCGVRDGFIGVSLNCYGNRAKAHYRQLVAQRIAIEAEIGQALDWLELPDKKESRIYLNRNTDPRDREQWTEQFAWLAQQLTAFDRAFRPRVKAIQAADVTSPSSSTDFSNESNNA